jgi:hypothetical protein
MPLVARTPCELSEGVLGRVHWALCCVIWKHAAASASLEYCRYMAVETTILRTHFENGDVPALSLLSSPVAFQPFGRLTPKRRQTITNNLPQIVTVIIGYLSISPSNSDSVLH